MIRYTERVGRRSYVSSGLGTAVAATVVFVAFMVVALALTAAVIAVLSFAWLARRTARLRRAGLFWGPREWVVAAGLALLAGSTIGWLVG